MAIITTTSSVVSIIHIWFTSKCISICTVQPINILRPSTISNVFLYTEVLWDSSYICSWLLWEVFYYKIRWDISITNTPSFHISRFVSSWPSGSIFWIEIEINSTFICNINNTRYYLSVNSSSKFFPMISLYVIKCYVSHIFTIG